MRDSTHVARPVVERVDVVYEGVRGPVTREYCRALRVDLGGLTVPRG